VPREIEPVFAAAEEVVNRYFAARVDDATRGTIEISGERYVLVRAASLSVEFLSLVRALYGADREAEADEFARNILFDLAHAIGKSDAHAFHAKMKLDDPLARLSAGPVHFAHSGWAFVEIDPSSRPQPNDDFYLLFDHPYSFEASAWLAADRAPPFSACVMSSGYSSGWCEESFDVTLVAAELLCRARGDEACRFVMAHPSRIEGVVAQYKASQPQLEARIRDAIIPDFFARKRMEEELRKSRDDLDERVVAEIAQRTDAERRLAHAQKLEAIGRLAGGVAHDFNNLLGVILGRSSMVQSRLASSDPLWAEMDAIRSACEQGASLTRHMLAFSRPEPAIARPIELSEVLTAASRGLLSLLGDDVELVVDVATDGTHVLADRTQLEQVLINLAMNARDAMPSGGTITLRSSTEEVPKCTVTTSVLPAGTYAVLRVTDTGRGMDPELQTKIFEPFFTTKPHGNGLGLSTVYGLVRQLGGAIDVMSAPAEGTTVTIYLPRVDASTDLTPSVPESRPPSTKVVRGTAKILVVEDQDSLRVTIEEALVEAGYHVIAVGDPMMAIALVERGGLELDVLLTDLVMAKMGGRELARRVQAHRPATRVLFMSGYDRDRAEAGGGTPGAPLLWKPFSIGDLTRNLHEVLEGAPA
jgi:signal transduction histidine kinase/CheY-like chemotaxis protein